MCARSCTDHLFSAQIQPKPSQPFLTSIMQLMHNAMRAHLNFIAGNLPTSPPRPTWGHSMHFYDQTPSPPPFIKSPWVLGQQEGCQSTGLGIFPFCLHLFLRTFQQPNPFCCNRWSTTNLSMISFLSRTIDFFLFLSLWIYLWLAETSQQPISQTTWLKAGLPPL